jgi:hypothetical protein
MGFFNHSDDEEDDYWSPTRRSSMPGTGPDPNRSRKLEVIDTNNRNPLTGALSYSEKLHLLDLLDQWEEPERHNNAAKVRTRLVPAFPFKYSTLPNIRICIHYMP